MNILLKLIRAMMADSDERPWSKSSRPNGGRRHTRRKTKENSRGGYPTHFYDPDAPDNRESSTDDLGLADLDRRQTDTLTRIEDAEATLAKERKRIEQLELRREEAEAREEQRRAQQDEDAILSPREKNRRAFERAVGRVERNAQRKIEELERRFAHSDKVFELSMARQEANQDEQRQREATEKELEAQHQNEQHHPGEQSARHNMAGQRA